MSFYRLMLIILTCATWILAQLSGPVIGYLAEGGKVRPARGIPGASLLGGALDLGLSLAAVSPKHDYILGSLTATGETVLVSMRDPSFSPRRIENARRSAGRMVLSPSAQAAAAYFGEGSVIQVFTDLDTDPKTAYEFEVPLQVGPFAVSSDGTAVIYSVREDGRDVLFVRDSSGEIRSPGVLGRAAAVAFALSGREAAVADAATDEVLAVRDDALVRLAGPREGIARPAAVAFTPDGLLIANSGARSVAIAPLDGGALRFVACPCSPTSLTALAEGVFQLTENGGGTVYILDTGRAAPAIWFIPASAGAGAQ